MTLLPIAGRELRVAARKRGTFWLRIAAALTALIIAGAVMILFHLARMPPAGTGTILFGVLTWLSLVAVLSAGLFFTSDCLSEEKREGTLGFLFLTDLRGYDVVAGKLFATSLRCFYALLAVFPILGVTLLVGGVTGAQFAKTLLALANALFYSLAAGMFVSALSRDSQKAMAGTLFLLLLLAWGGPLADSLHDRLTGGASGPFFSLSSPWHIFQLAGEWAPTSGSGFYWTGVFVNQAIAWALLILACVLVPRTWQERGRRTKTAKGDWSYFWRYGSARYRAALRRKLLDRNPVLWLACRERWQALAIWAVAILMMGQFAFVRTSWRPGAFGVWSYIHGVAILMVYLWLTAQASRFFVDARRTGLVELLLASPVESGVIVRGQWRSLVRMFALPLIIILGAQLTATCINEYASLAARARMTSNTTVRTARSTNGRVTRTYSSTTTIGTNATTTAGTNSFAVTTTAATTGPEVAVMIATAVTGAATSLANLIALCWFGMWMGMTSKNNNLATLKTIVFVQIIPLLAAYFISALLYIVVMMPVFVSRAGKNPNSSAWASSMMVWFPFLFTGSIGVLSVIKDIAFSLWARNKLRTSFREQAVQGTGPIHFKPPPRLPPPTPPSLPPPTMAAHISLAPGKSPLDATERGSVTRSSFAWREAFEAAGAVLDVLTCCGSQSRAPTPTPLTLNTGGGADLKR